MDDTNVWVVAFGSDKTSKAVTSCARSYANHFAQYYRRVGYYSVRILDQDELNELLEREHNNRLRYCFE